MFKNPYETTACRQYALTAIVRGLKEEMAERNLVPLKLSNGEVIDDLYEVHPHSHNISPFTQVVDFEYLGRTIYVVDMRPFMSKRPDVNGKFTVYSDIEYQLAKINALLSQRWTQGFVRDQSTFGDLGGKAFTRLLTDAIVRRLGIGPVEQMNVAAVSAYYYLCLFMQADQLDESVRHMVIGRVARLTMIPAERLIELLQDLPIINNLDEYCQALKKVGGSERFDVINPGTLLTSVGGVWFGANAREHVAVALEYPPTFNALLYCAITYRGYHNAPLSRLVQTIDRNGMSKEFARSVNAYVKD